MQQANHLDKIHEALANYEKWVCKFHEGIGASDIVANDMNYRIATDWKAGNPIRGCIKKLFENYIFLYNGNDMAELLTEFQDINETVTSEIARPRSGLISLVDELVTSTNDLREKILSKINELEWQH